MTKKYEFTNETLNYCGHVLYRIKALINFGHVKAGQLGGWIERESNLSQYGYCWVADEAKVFNNAKVYENAQVYGNAEVYDCALVYGETEIYGDAQAYDDAQVCGHAQIFGRAVVYGKAIVYDYAQVYGNAQVFGNVKVWDNVGGDEKVFGDISTTKNNTNMEKKYKASINITMSKDIYVDAENEEEAKQKAIENAKENSYYLAGSADSCVNCVVTNIVDEDENVRLWLISQLKIKSDDTNSDKNDMINMAIDYLEKQGGKSVK